VGGNGARGRAGRGARDRRVSQGRLRQCRARSTPAGLSGPEPPCRCGGKPRFKTPSGRTGLRAAIARRAHNIGDSDELPVHRLAGRRSCPGRRRSGSCPCRSRQRRSGGRRHREDCADGDFDHLHRGGGAEVLQHRSARRPGGTGRRGQGADRARQREAAERRPQAAGTRHLQGDLARHGGRRLPQDEGQLRVHRQTLTMEAAELGLTAARGVQIAASLSALGVAAFWSMVAPPVLAAADGPTRRRIEAGLRQLFHASLAVAVAAGLVWLAAQAAFMAEADSLADAAAALWPVLTDTHFGHILGARLVLLALSAPALGNGSNGGRRVLAAGMAALALILHTWSTHAAAAAGIERTMLLGAASLHLLAAGAWLGSLVPLFAAVGALAPEQCARTARRFSPLGMLCVAILAGTALVQGWILIGGLPALVGTDYGRIALVKLALLLVLLAFAAANRFRYAPAMHGPAGAAAKRGLRRSIAVETAVGLVVVFAASLLADLPPAQHQQPVWPF